MIPHIAEANAARAARTAYRAAAERHAERALSELDAGHRNRARYLARLAGLLERVAAREVAS